MPDNRFSRTLPAPLVWGTLSFAASDADAAMEGIVEELRRLGLVTFHQHTAHGVVVANLDLVLTPAAVARINATPALEEARPALTSKDGFDWAALSRLRKSDGIA